MLTRTKGEPRELLLAPEFYADVSVLKNFELDLAYGSIIYAAYTHYAYEKLVKEAARIELFVARKAYSQRMHAPWIEYFISRSRKTIEGAFSQVTNLLPKDTRCYCSRLSAQSFLLFSCL